jgi:hypothetical protein
MHRQAGRPTQAPEPPIVPAFGNRSAKIQQCLTVGEEEILRNLGFPTLRMQQKQFFQIIRPASRAYGQQYYRIELLRLVVLWETMSFRPLAIGRWAIRNSGRVQPC